MLGYVPGGSGAGGRPDLRPQGGEHLAHAYGNEGIEDVPGIFEFHPIHDREPIVLGPFTITPVGVKHTSVLRLPGRGRRPHARLHRRHRSVRRADVLMTGADLVLADALRRRSRPHVASTCQGARAAEAAVAPGECSASCSRTCPRGTIPTSAARGRRGVAGWVEVAKPGATYVVNADVDREGVAS